MAKRSLSPSSIDLWKTCQRKWAFTYLHKRREPPAKSAQAGTHVHKILETNDHGKSMVWLGYDLSKMAALLRDATPQGVLVSEEKFVVTLDGLEFNGVIDFQTEDTIGDYKTTSKLKYVKTYAELTDNPQRLIYVRAKPQRRKTLWLYGVWENFSVHARPIDVDPVADTERFKVHVLSDAEQMLAVPDDCDPLSLPMPENPKKTCALYPPKGCPFKNECYAEKKAVIGVSKLMKKLKGASAGTQEQAMPEKERMLEAAEQLRVWSEADDVIAQASKEQVSVNQIEETYDQRLADAVVKQVGARMLDDGKIVFDAGKPIRNLYINCMPMNGNFEHAAKLVEPSAQLVADEAHLPSAFLVDFGKGPAMVAAQLKADLLASGRVIEHLYVETKSNEGRAVVNTLVLLAHNVIQGVF